MAWRGGIFRDLFIKPPPASPLATLTAATGPRPSKTARFNDGGNYLSRTTGLPDAATGVLISAWVKVNFSGTPPYGRGNDYPFWLDGTNWQTVHNSGNLNSTTSTDNATYNTNSGFSADATGMGDFTMYIQQFMPEVQNLDYVWVCWQVIAPPNSDVTIRQWHKFGNEMPLIFREDVITLASIRTATGNGTWSAGALTSIRIGDNHDGNGSVHDMMRVRIEQYGSMPSDAKLTAIAALDAADTSAWGDYLLAYDDLLTDRSGNGRTLTQTGTITEGVVFNDIASDPYVVQARPKTSGSTNALAETFAATPTVGNTVLIRGTARNAGTITASDNQGNTYTVYVNAPASNHKSFVIVAPITTASGTFTVTVSGLGTTATQYQLEELQGSYTVDWSALPNTQSAGLTVNAPSANTAEAIVFGVCVPITSGATVFNPGGGYKSITGQDDNNGILLVKLSASGVTESITYPAPSSGNISGILVGLVRTAGGGSASITFDGSHRVFNTAQNTFDGSARVLNSAQAVLDGSHRVFNASPAAVFDASHRVYNAVQNTFDGSHRVYNAASNTFDASHRIFNAASNTLDGAHRVFNSVEYTFGGSYSVEASGGSASITFDGSHRVFNTAQNTFDGSARVLNSAQATLDGSHRVYNAVTFTFNGAHRVLIAGAVSQLGYVTRKQNRRNQRVAVSSARYSVKQTAVEHAVPLPDDSTFSL